MIVCNNQLSYVYGFACSFFLVKLFLFLFINNKSLMACYKRSFYSRIMVFISRGILTWWLWVGVSRHRGATVGTAGGPQKACDLLAGPLKLVLRTSNSHGIFYIHVDQVATRTNSKTTWATFMKFGTLVETQYLRYLRQFSSGGVQVVFEWRAPKGPKS